MRVTEQKGLGRCLKTEGDGSKVMSDGSSLIDIDGIF